MPSFRIKERKNFAKTGYRWFFASPIRLIVFSFFAVIMVGMILLTLPVSSVNGVWTPVQDALFTSTSAVCVTGLIIFDTVLYWSLFGQIVILCLIQIGGLGLATITIFFLTVFSKRNRKDWKRMQLAQESTSNETIADVMHLVHKVMKITFVFEVSGAVILAWRFWPVYGSGAIFRGLFHSISAFCNAGFDLQGDNARGAFSSLMLWQNDPFVLLTTSFLIIAGGLGFIVWVCLYEFVRYKKQLPFHARTVLVLTGLLLLFATIFFLVAEGDNVSNADSLGSMPWPTRILNAFFQAVTPRTAGFNSIDQATLSDSSKFMTSILMFLGASPAGTGGGIKLTTMAVLVALVFSEIRGDEKTVLWKHKISFNTAVRAVVIVFMASSTVIVAVLAISFIEHKALMTGSFRLLDVIFESSSAFGTVGLSSIGTGKLHSASHLVLVVCMYIGRVGPVSLALSLAYRKMNKNVSVMHPEARLLVG